MSEENIIRAIGVLLFRRCPTAIVGGVVPIIVDPVQCGAINKRVGHSLSKTGWSFPFVAYLNPSTSVSVIGWMIGRVAALHHAIPNGVNMRSGKAVRSMEVPVRPRVVSEASAARAFPSFHVREDRGAVVATIAGTYCMDNASALLSEVEDCQSPKPVSYLGSSAFYWLKAKTLKGLHFMLFDGPTRKTIP